MFQTSVLFYFFTEDYIAKTSAAQSFLKKSLCRRVNVAHANGF